MMRRSTALLAAIATLSVESGAAFTTPSHATFSISSRERRTRSQKYHHPIHQEDPAAATFDPLYLCDDNDISTTTEQSFPHALSIAAVALLGAPSVTNAAGPDWGIFEGRIGSLLHPVMMGSMFAFSLSTALLGFQYRRQRTMVDEISELKKSIPAYEGDSLIAALASAEAAETVDTALVRKLQAAMPIQAEVDTLVQERKDLIKAGPKDKHFGQGAILAFLGTSFAIEGPLNTYARAGKLFPGPHLYAGAGLVVLWSLAAAQVPAMQKGSDTARSVHIAANAAGIGLFAWQITSGWPILLKVIEKTSWP